WLFKQLERLVLFFLFKVCALSDFQDSICLTSQAQRSFSFFLMVDLGEIGQKANPAANMGHPKVSAPPFSA
ncbi:MAG: hypothetical protein K9K63_06285, partial [Desulfotignum sp.]|nr:hypothetical protein [Desulfotignum sp.]MCF8136902.1 hypothetical protein [Desulfotignum sp.]